MRSFEEIRFRLAQQAENAWLYAFTPKLKRNAPTADLPLPKGEITAATPKGTAFAASVEQIAQQILQHRFPLFGKYIDVGPDIEWRKDYVNGQTTGTGYFRFIPYLDFTQAGDHKNIWELSRHQHLVLLGQAWLFTENPLFLQELEAQLTSWFEQNRFLHGINFASALEVAFRALSWLWIDHLVGAHLNPDIRYQLQNGMLQHGYFLKANLSTYFSPNTHLLGEGVALFALGLKFPQTGWKKLGERIVSEERDRQIQNDGSHFEQSTYYHVYALDFFLFYYLLAGRPANFEQPLRKMASFLSAVNGPAGLLSFFGDDDGGRLFHPYGDRSTFGRATLASCASVFPDAQLPVDCESLAEQSAWWLGPHVPLGDSVTSSDFAELFANSGLVSIARGSLHVLIDTGPFGPGGAGHSHSDTLSFTVRNGARELLIDPGTFTYVADPQARDEFRGSGYHNTLRINHQNQADPTRPFRWDNKPEVTRSAFHVDTDNVYVDAACRTRGITHRRRFFLVGSKALFLLDDVTGPVGVHHLEQFWHLGKESDIAILCNAPVPAKKVSGWRSRCLGSKEETPVIAYGWSAELPCTVATVFLFSATPVSANLIVEGRDSSTIVRLGEELSVEFPDSGTPHLVAHDRT